jgi:hypothetical protein
MTMTNETREWRPHDGLAITLVNRDVSMRRELDGLGNIRTARYKGGWSSPVLFILLTTKSFCRFQMTATLEGLQRARQIRSTHEDPGVSAHHEGSGGSVGCVFAAVLA